MSKLTVVVFRVGEEPAIEQINPGLESMQTLVGGCVECRPLARGRSSRESIDLWCDEEGTINDQPPNRVISPDLVIHGNFFLAAHDEESGTKGLTPFQCAEWIRIAKSWPIVH